MTPLWTLEEFPDEKHLARAVADAWVNLVHAANCAGMPHYVALSGGRTAKSLFTTVSQQAVARHISFSNAHFFWADERSVPPDDAESNFRTAREFLFSPLNIPADHIHRIQGEKPPEVAATAAEAEIRRLAPHDSNGMPRLDLIFLGMGEDGHVASLFPGESIPTMAGEAVYRAVTNSPKPPANRVTLGYAAIAAARQVWVLVSGAGKGAALRASLEPAGQTALARVLAARVQTRIFTDVSLH